MNLEMMIKMMKFLAHTYVLSEDSQNHENLAAYAICTLML